MRKTSLTHWNSHYNLIFTNIHEAVGEAHEQTEHKLCERNVEKCKLVQQGVNDIQSDSIVTMVPGIINVAKFTLFKDREVVRKSRMNLKRTGHYINDQFPPNYDRPHPKVNVHGSDMTSVIHRRSCNP